MADVEGIVHLAGYLLDDLVYDLLKANAFVFSIRDPPYAGISARNSAGSMEAYWPFLLGSGMAILV